MPFVTLRTLGDAAIHEDALVELGLVANQAVPDEMLWDIIAANARSLCREMERSGRLDEKLAEMCGYTRMS